jgi:hypothetical protein
VEEEAKEDEEVTDPVESSAVRESNNRTLARWSAARGGEMGWRSGGRVRRWSIVGWGVLVAAVDKGASKKDEGDDGW